MHLTCPFPCRNTQMSPKDRSSLVLSLGSGDGELHDLGCTWDRSVDRVRQFKPNFVGTRRKSHEHHRFAAGINNGPGLVIHACPPVPCRSIWPCRERRCGIRFYNNLKDTRGLPNAAQVKQTISNCGFSCGLKILGESSPERCLVRAEITVRDFRFSMRWRPKRGL
jgi:hypothetical protein